MAIARPSNRDALLFARGYIQKGFEGTGDEKRFEYITSRLQENPCFVLERSRDDFREWNQQKVTVKDAIGRFLPSDIYRMLTEKANLSDMQNIMDLHTYKDFRSNILTHHLSDSRELVEVMHISEPDPVACKLGVYYIRLNAEYEGHRWATYRQEVRALTADFKYQEFTAITSLLVKVMQEKENEAVAEAVAQMRLNPNSK